jgi:hypothetical protein
VTGLSAYYLQETHRDATLQTDMFIMWWQCLYSFMVLRTEQTKEKMEFLRYFPGRILKDQVINTNIRQLLGIQDINKIIRE